MQVILGSNGTIGHYTALALKAYTNQIRLVSRTPVKVNENDILFPADLTQAEQVMKAVEGCDIAYLLVGLPYNSAIWEIQWPLIMKNVINACAYHKCKLVFFDNLYMYGAVSGWMTEETPYNPSSKKGLVRKNIAELLMNAVEKGKLNALIARSADFYGPNTPTSVVSLMVFENLKKGKKAQWMIDLKYLHSFTYTPDAGNATALLGNTASAYNQIWHLPSDENVLTGKEFIDKAGQYYPAYKGATPLPLWMLKMVGVFNPLVKESIEMLYQNQNDYLFNSSKFTKAFNVKPTPYDTGIKKTAMYYK